MEFLNLHPWHVTVAEAKAIQNDLAAQVIRHNQFGEIKTVAGADIALRVPPPGVRHLGEKLKGFRRRRRSSFPTSPACLPFAKGRSC